MLINWQEGNMWNVDIQFGFEKMVIDYSCDAKVYSWWC
jgi:hypothetical protein